jgi:hypothetical protein
VRRRRPWPAGTRRAVRGSEGFASTCVASYGPPPVSPDDILEPPLSLSLVISAEDAAEVGRGFHPHVHLGDAGHRVLHDVKLVLLPWHSGQHGFLGGTKAGVVIADDQRHSEHAPNTERFEKLEWTAASLRATLHPRNDRLPSGSAPIAGRRAQGTTVPSIRTFP